MTMNPLPPQAFTKDTLQKAYVWLLSQPAGIKEMASTQDVANIDYGDMSNAWGMAPGDDHKSHGGGSKNKFLSVDSGICIDYRYLNSSYQSFQGEVSNPNFDVTANVSFLNIAGKWGFNKNYISDQDVWKLGPVKATPNGTGMRGHNDHGHLTYSK